MFLSIVNGKVKTEDFISQEGDIKIYFRGYIIWNDKLHLDEECIPIILDHYQSGIIPGKILDYNGTFNCVIAEGKKVLIFNDRHGFFPLQYYYDKDNFVLSDNWKKLVPFAGKSIRKDALIDMFAIGHTLGHKTLVEGILEIDSATINRIEIGTNGFNFISEKYWKPVLEFKSGKSSKLEKDFVDLWKYRIGIYIDHIKSRGNVCVQMLSGGFDSRLMINEFDQAGIQIKALTFGKGPDCGQVIAASNVVKQLKNCNEHKIFYHDQLILDQILASSVEYDRITNMRTGDKELYYLDKFSQGPWLMGYSGDFGAGRHFKYKMRYWKTNQDLLSYVMQSKIIPLIRQDLRENSNHRMIFQDSFLSVLDPNDDPLTSMYKWDLEYRQRRFIVRPNIQTDRNNTEFLIPFFDYEIMDFFTGLPMDALLNSKLYINAQLKFLYNNNKELAKIKRDNIYRQRLVKNNLLYEYKSKFREQLRSYNITGKKRNTSLWSEDIDWNRYNLTEELKSIIGDIDVNTNVAGNHHIYLLTLLKFYRELQVL